MRLLNEQHRQRALEAMREYLSAPPGLQGKTPIDGDATLDEKRVALIEQELKSLLDGYLEAKVALPDFKSKVDSINKRHSLWGFKGIKGQMFFNMVVNVADVLLRFAQPTAHGDVANVQTHPLAPPAVPLATKSSIEQCDRELKAALAAPADEEIASSRMRRFASYVKRLGDQWVEAGNTRYGSPKLGSVPFFLSYFWQVQDRGTWPVFYTSSVQAMTDLNLWQPSGDLSEDFVAFKHIHEELAELFTRASGQPFDLYGVEHVFWYKGGSPYQPVKDVAKAPPQVPVEPPLERADRLPESYVPPIVAILPRMARHEDALVEAAKRSGTTLERAFEKHINAAFTILGYETRLLGQGKGRVPDGLALALDDSYAILWDAKVRSNEYSIGTDDRTIREYITRQSRELKKRRPIRNIYYMIVSSTFADDHDDAIRSIKMETDVSEVSLIEAEALVAMVDAKLRSPLEITLGPDGLQRLFTLSTVVTAEMVRKELV